MGFFEGYQQTLVQTFPELTAPGVTDTIDVLVANYLSTRNYTISVTVTNINTNVVVRLDGSIDGTNYGPLISNTITENGTYLYYVNGFPVGYLRGNFLREVGGTDAVVKFSIAAN
jgi:hypothetical protein